MEVRGGGGCSLFFFGVIFGAGRFLGKKRPIHGKWGVFYPEGGFWVKNAPFTVNRAFFTIFRQAEGRRAEGGFYPGPIC